MILFDIVAGRTIIDIVVYTYNIDVIPLWWYVKVYGKRKCSIPPLTMPLKRPKTAFPGVLCSMCYYPITDAM